MIRMPISCDHSVGIGSGRDGGYRWERDTGDLDGADDHSVQHRQDSSDDDGENDGRLRCLGHKPSGTNSDVERVGHPIIQSVVGAPTRHIHFA